MKTALGRLAAVCTALSCLSCGGSIESLDGEARTDESALAAAAVVKDRELVITDLGVVEDPVRTRGTGVWTFGKLMTDMAGPVDPSDFVLELFQHWRTDQTLLGSTAPARPAIDTQVLDSWPRLPSGKLDLARAPMRLLAIVNRMDLRDLSRGTAGEGRFVFGVLGAGGRRLPFTLILEYRLPARTPAQVQAWATRWHGLAGFAPGSADFNSRLEAITTAFARRGAEPGRPNGSALGQIRSNENALNLLWELREFRIEANGHLRQVPVGLTPDKGRNASAELGTQMNSDQTLFWRYLSSDSNNGLTALWNMSQAVPLSGSGLPTVPPADWELQGSGDFNRDGSTDLVWRYLGADPAVRGKLVLWYMNGTALAGSAIVERALPDLRWHVQAVGDLDRDGYPDLVWRFHGAGSQKGQNMIWMLRDTVFKSRLDLPAEIDLTWHPEGVGDFNADGKADLVWRRRTSSGPNRVWLLSDGHFVRSKPLPPVPDLDWRLEGVGAFNADTKPDLLWRYYGTAAGQGSVVAWLMNGLELSASASIATVSDLNWKLAGVGLVRHVGASSDNDIIPQGLIGGRDPVWKASNVRDNATRHAFALNTCNGCHGLETQTAFLHINPREPGVPSVLSLFMRGGSAPDPVTGEVRAFNDLERRAADFAAVITASEAALQAQRPLERVH